MGKERLQPVNKIILATGSINYMATHIHTIHEQMKTVKYEDGNNPHKDSLHDQEQTLRKTLIHLGKAMDELAEYMEGYDSFMPIDALVLNPAFHVMDGMDDVDRVSFDEE